MKEPLNENTKIVYCRCAFARVVPQDVKDQVLEDLSASGRSFGCVADLCQLSAAKDSELENLALMKNLKVVACYPRAVRWLFKAAGVEFPKDAQVLNMRTQTAEAIGQALGLSEPVDP